MTVPVLYLNHTAELSGSEHSLLSLLRCLALPAATDTAAAPGSVRIAPVLACPADGPLLALAVEAGAAAVSVPAFTAGFTRDPRSLGAYLSAALAGARHLARHVRATEAQIVHANSVRAGIVASLGRLLRLYPAPLIVHVRDCVPRTAVGRAIRLLVDAASARIVANSHYVARDFALSPRMLAKTRAVHNGVDLARFDPGRVTPAQVAALRAELGLAAEDAPILAIVGQISPWKGHEDAIRALAAVTGRYPSAHLLVVGGLKFTQATARYDNRAFFERLKALIAELELDRRVTFTGERADIPQVMALSDAVLVPSWEEPFGRTVIEAMAMARPVVATAAGGPAEIVVEGTGALTPPRESHSLARIILSVLDHPSDTILMATRGQRRVRAHFSAEAHAAAVVRVYQEVLCRP